ncbi:MAG: metallophosphoesterase [Ignavibacteriaceae bacterium]
MWIIIRVLIAIPLLFIIQLYFSKKVKITVKTLFPDFPDGKRKLILTGFLLLLNAYPLLLIINAVYAAITKQSVSFPQNNFADYFIIYPFWIVLMIIVQICLFFVIVDFFKLLFLPLYKKHKEKLLVLQSKFFLGLIFFFLIYVPARIIYDYNSVDIRHVEFDKKSLPEKLDGFRIAFISDIQADRYTDEKRLSRYIEAVNSTNSDLVLIAGDVITSSPDYIQTAAKFIGKIKSEYGVYSCVGDHDNWAYRRDTPRSIREITEALNYHSVEMVNNDIRTIEIDGSRIGITFITNTYVESINDSLLSKLSDSNHKDFKIFLTHQPQNFLINSALNNQYDLFLAGHTHGGQITFLFPFFHLSPTLVETNYVKGDFYFNDMLAIVNGGLGMSLAPVRYNSTPEVVLITLRRK